MSFKVGDRVRCVDPGQWTKLVKGLVYKITDIAKSSEFGGSVCVDGIRDDWWYADRFELLPQPVESPDDWVTQDVVRARPGIDERAYRYDTTPEAGLQWDRAGAMKWDPMPMHGERGNGLTVHLRCRRRDYPQKPVEVHSVGPYVARSEYERVCTTIRELETGYAAAVRRAEDMADQLVVMTGERDGLQRELANERASSGQVIADLRDSLKQSHLANKVIVTERDQRERESNRIVYDLNAVRATLEKRDAEVANLRHEQSVLLADLKNFEDTTAAINKRVLGGNPNGWPLVPVDPECIPEGHRAVEVTRNTKNKLVASHSVRRFSGYDSYARLVVEPIPQPLPEPKLPRGWWYGYDAEGRWWGCSLEPVPCPRGYWEVKGSHNPLETQIEWRKLEGMPEADKKLWADKCWKVQ